MMNGDSVLLKMIMAFIYIWKKDNFLSFGILKIFRHAEYESARRDLNFLWDKSLSY